MQQRIQYTPLSDEDRERFDELLGRYGAQGINQERLDGLFTALICAPTLIMPSQYFPLILCEDSPFETEDDMSEMMELVMAQWNGIVAQLECDDEDAPYEIAVVEHDGVESIAGEEWATGFTMGMHLTHDDWQALLEDDEQAGYLVPIFALANLRSDDPDLRPYGELPISEERHEQLLLGLTVGALFCHDYFAEQRRARAIGDAAPIRRGGPKIGRNEPCPCGSGRKYKRCCLNATRH